MSRHVHEESSEARETGAVPGRAGLAWRLLLLGLAINPWSLGWALAEDRSLDATRTRMVIFAGQAVLLAGAAVCFRARVVGPAGRVGRLLRMGLLLVGGLGVAGSGAQLVRHVTRAKPPWEMSFPELCHWLIEGDNRYFGTGRLRSYRANLAQALKTPDKVRVVVEARINLATILLRQGARDGAIEQLELAYGAASAYGHESDVMQRIRRSLGIAHFRRGEVSHCIAMHNPQSCLFPISGAGVWSNPSAALDAIRYFEEFLEVAPQDPGVRWLLNLAHMTVGSYPQALADDALIPLEMLSRAGGIGRFRDIAGELGVATFDGAGGALLDDLDGDGFLDIVTSSIFPCSPLKYFHNEGDGTFADWSERAGLAHQLGGLNLLQTDYDNDGRLDIFVLRGAWMGPEHGRQRNSLLAQTADGTLRDVTQEAGLATPAYPCQAGSSADYDNDGWLDLYVGNERFPCQLFRNQQDRTFKDVAARAGVANRGVTKGVAWGDYDNDGDLDLYVSNLGTANHLYENQGTGEFTDVTSQVLGAERDPIEGKSAELTFVSWFWDYDNDGWLDLYIGGFGASLSDVAGDYLGLPNPGKRLQLYHNEGAAGAMSGVRFRDVTAEVGLYRVHLPMGANHGDVDNDGWLDLYLGTGQPGFEYLVPNVLYRNQSGTGFSDVTTVAGVGHLQKGHGVAFGDLDNDGDQDLLAQMGGFYPDDGFHNALFENPGNPNHWLTLVLRGVDSNRFGVGARIQVNLLTPAGSRAIHLVAGSGGSFGSSSLQQEIGLGDALSIESVRVSWPASATEQVFRSVELDSVYRVTEGEDELERLDPKRIRRGTD